MMLQGEAASQATPLCDVIHKSRIGRGNCDDFCNNLYKEFNISADDFSRCINKCSESYPVNGSGAGNDSNTGDAGSDSNTGDAGSASNGDNKGDNTALCDLLRKQRFFSRRKCDDFCNNLHKEFNILAKYLSRCIDKCKQLYG